MTQATYKIEPGVSSPDVYSEPGISDLVYQRQDRGSHRGEPEDLITFFRRLRDRTIVTIEGDVCCQTCGGYECGNHADELEENGYSVAGYAFYHIQCIESSRGEVLVFDNIPIYYGAFEDGEEATRNIGRQIVDIAQESNVPVEWDGDPHTAIFLYPDE